MNLAAGFGPHTLLKNIWMIESQASVIFNWVSPW